MDTQDEEESETSAAAYIHISHVSDTRVEKIEKTLKPGQTISVRIIGHRPIDGLNVATARDSLLALPFLSARDARLGAMVPACNVMAVHEWGIVVMVGGGIGGGSGKSSGGMKAMIPATHITDSGSRKALKKIKVGSKLQCRVLQVNTGGDGDGSVAKGTKPRKTKVILTHKRSLVHNEELGLLTTYDTVAAGDVHHGFVGSIQKFGIVVRFFGRVVGLIHRSEIGAISTDDTDDEVVAKLSGLYSVGQLIRVVVRSTNKRHLRRRLLLGLLDGNTSERTGFNTVMKSEMPSVGAVVTKAKVVAVVEGDADARTGSKVAVAFEYLTSARSLKTVYGIVDIQQLSDFHDLVESEFKSLMAGQSELGPLVVMHHQYVKPKSTSGSFWIVDERGGVGHSDEAQENGAGSKKPLSGWCCHLSCKRALVHSKTAATPVATLPSEIGHMRVNDIIVGFVASISASGLHIRCLNSITGLAHHSRSARKIENASDGAGEELSKHFTRGQTVYARVIKVNAAAAESGGKFTLSLVDVFGNGAIDNEGEEGANGSAATNMKTAAMANYLCSRLQKARHVVSSNGELLLPGTPISCKVRYARHISNVTPTICVRLQLIPAASRPQYSS